MGEVVVPNYARNEGGLLRTFLNLNPSIDFIRLQFVDYSAVVRTRVVTKSFALSLAEDNTFISLPSPVLSAIILDNTINMDDIDVGEDEMWADWSTLRILPHLPGTASAMTYHKESGVIDGKGFLRCPRSRLREIIDSSKSKHDMDFLVGIEMEFFILTPEELKGHGPTSDTFSAGVWSTSSMLSPHLPVLEEIVRSLTQAGIEVRQFHSEGEIGLFELTIAPLPPLEAADALIFMHETVKIVCAKRGLHATMHPKPFEKKSIVGSHIHMSMTRIDREESFLAGLLEHYAALSAFWAPNYDSYFRVKPTDWVCWSLLNKTALIRKLCPGRWEIRGPDATMNVYLVLLAIIQAGLLGFESEKTLTHQDPKRVLWGAPLTDEEAEKFWITDKPPTTLKMALEKLKNDKALSESLGLEIVEKYLKVKNKEESIFGEMTLSERKEIAMKIF